MNEKDLLEYIQQLTTARTNLEFQVMVLTKKLNDLTSKTVEATIPDSGVQTPSGE